jgi:PAS domain S-box-containing protein
MLGGDFVVSTSPLFDDSKNISGCVHVARDITERKKVVEELQKNEEKFRNIVNSSPMGMHMYEIGQNGDLIFIGANPAADKILGIDNGQFIGKTIEAAFPPLADSEVPKRYKHAANEGEPWFTEQINYQDEQIQGAFEVHAFQTSPGKMVAMFLDITHRKKAEEALIESEEKYRNIVENINDIIYSVDKDGIIQFITPSIEGMGVGYKVKDIIGHSFTDFIHEDDIERIINEFGETMKGISSPSEYRIVSKFGEIHWVLDSSKPIYNGDKFIGLQGVLTDITERKMAKDALMESEEKFRMVFENAGEGILYINANGDIIDINPKVEKISGHKRKDIVGKNFLDLVSIFQLDPEEMERAFEEIMSQTPELNTEWHIKNKKGQNRILLAKPSLLMKDNEDVIGISVIIEDITEAKTAEQALRKSEERFRDLANLLPQTVFEVDVEGRITYSNQSGFETTGYSQEDIDSGLDVFKLFVPDEIERVVENIAKILNGENILDHEYIMQRSDGTTFPALIYSRPIVHENKSKGLRGILIDISDLKGVEKALKDSEEKYKNLISNLSEVIIEIDSDMKFSYISPQISESFGFEPEEVVGTDAIEFIHPDDRESSFSKIEEAVEKGEVANFEFRTLHKKGHYIEVSGTGRLVKEDDDYKIVGIVQDVTDRKRFQEKIIEERNRAELYLDILGHDLTNLNQAIISSSELLLINKELTENEKRYIHNIYQQANVISDLIVNVRILSELQETDFRKKRINLYKIIHQSIDNINLTYKDRKIKIIHSLPKSGLSIKGNELMKDVFDNILENAVKYNNNGEIEVEISHSGSKNNKFWKLEIKDNGPGVPDEMKGQIFERLKRGVKSVHGSGLGLTIVKEIINRHNGDIWVEDRVKNEPDKGCNFVILLPKGGR